MKIDETEGWGGVPAALNWTCPECKVTTATAAWQETSLYCEDCGEHDGRECPNCGHVFDYVWNTALIEANS